MSDPVDGGVPTAGQAPAGPPASAGRPQPGVGARGEALIVAAAWALVYPWLLPPLAAVGSAGDDGVYVALGRALAHGEGYRSIFALGAPAHAKFPPFLPLIYALVWRSGADLHSVALLARALNCLVLAMVAGLLWWLARARLRVGRVLAASLVLGPLLLDSSLQYNGLALSEPWFLLAWASALVLVARPDVAGRAGAGVGTGVALGLVLGCAVLVRTQAVVLWPACVIALLVTRARRGLVLTTALCGLAPPLFWLLLRPLLTGGGPPEAASSTYLGDLGGPGPQLVALLQGIPTRLRVYVSIFAPFLAPSLRIGGVLVGLWCALALLGLFRLGRRAPALVLSVALDALLIMLWPYTIDRFVLSLAPFAGLGAAYWLDRELARRRPLVRAAMLGLCVLIAGEVAVRQVYVRRMGAAAAQADQPAAFWTPSYTIPAVSRYIRLASPWVAAHTARGTAVAAAWPEGIFLLTGRQTVNLEPAESALRRSVHADSGRFLARAITAGARAVIVWDARSPSEREQSAVARACPGALRAAGQTGRSGYPKYYLVADTACVGALAAGRSGPSGEVVR